MPKQKDSFTCTWVLESNRRIRERIVLFETSSSDDSILQAKSSTTFASRARITPNENTSTTQVENKHRKSVFRGILSVLQVCLEEFSILKRFCGRPVELAWNEPLLYKTLEQLYDGPDESYDMFKLDDMRKSLRDISILFNILSSTYSEIQKTDTYTVLENSSNVLWQEFQDEKQLLDGLKKGYRYKDFLKVTLDKELLESEDEFLKICEEVGRSKLILEDVLGFVRSKYIYNSEWETSRLEQKMWSVSKEIQALEETTLKCKLSIANEIRVDSEINKYCAESINEMNHQINEWQVKYETSLEKDESTIIYYKNELEVLIVRHADMVVLYDQRVQQMKDWIEYRTQKEINDTWLFNREKAARRIQCWWRWQLFRLKIGPYRPKKRKKGKAKKKGRKAKK